MNKLTLSLAAVLLLSVTPIAYAQDGPRDQMPGPSLERGPSADMPGGGGDGPRGGRANDGAGPRDEGPGSAGSATGDGAPLRRSEGPNPALRDDAPRGEPSGAERKAERKDAPSAKEKRADDSGKSPRKSADDAKASDRKAKQKAEKPDKSPDKATSETNAKRDSQAKSDTDRGDRAKAKDAAETDRAQPADAGKKADTKAEGDRKPVDEVKKADLSGEKRTRVESAFRESRDVKRRTDVDINISVGSRLPRDWDFVPVPVAVIDVVPEYRGYVFAYVEDEYVICDPVTYEVVAVLPAGDRGPDYAGGGGGAVVADRCSANLTLSEDEKADIVRSIQITDEVDVSNITVGWSVPGDIELRRFPDPVLSQTGKLESCRYFVADNQIAIVDPAEETVVLLIDHND